MKVFLDLEQTIILSWEDPELCNVEKISSLLIATNIKSVSIFSFAIWNEDDKKHFDFTLRPLIETALKVRVDSWPSVDDMRREIMHKLGTDWDQHEFISVWGKSRAFFDWCRMMVKENALLIDDVVDDEILMNNRTGFAISTMNVDRM